MKILKYTRHLLQFLISPVISVKDKFINRKKVANFTSIHIFSKLPEYFKHVPNITMNYIKSADENLLSPHLCAFFNK